MKIENRIEQQIRTMLQNTIVLNKKYLDDEQLDRKEQFEVLKEIFDVNVRSKEISELSSHFAPMFKDGHPVHLSLLGKTGTGKTVTILYFLNMFKALCAKNKIPVKYIHLDLSIPKPCFRALNDLACLLNATKRYKRGISLDELMSRIEDKLKPFTGYFILFVDEIDHVRRDPDSFLKFLIRRLPQSVRLKLVVIFTSNKLNWQENIDPRIKSFLKLNEILFDPYNALDLEKILSIRIGKALDKKMIERGVVKKISAISSRTHGDARKAVELLSKSAQIAERQGIGITLELVDKALQEIEQDKYVAMIKSAPGQLKAVLYSVLSFSGTRPVNTSDSYDVYRLFCAKAKTRALTQRAFSDLISELDIYGFIKTRIVSQGRYGRKKEITTSLPKEVSDKLKEIILLEFDLEIINKPDLK